MLAYALLIDGIEIAGHAALQPTPRLSSRGRTKALLWAASHPLRSSLNLQVEHSQENLAGETMLREQVRDWRLPSGLDDYSALISIQLAVLTAIASNASKFTRRLS